MRRREVPFRRIARVALLVLAFTVARLVVRSAPYLPAAGWALGGAYAYLAVLCIATWPVGLLLVAAAATASWWLAHGIPEGVRQCADALAAFDAFIASSSDGER